MQKKIVAFVLIMLIISGCSSTSKPKVTIVGQNDWWIAKEISNATQGIGTKLVNNKYTEFDISDADFIDDLNTRASTKGYSELVQLPTWDAKPSSNYSLDGKYYLSLCDVAYNPEISLNLYSDGEARARRNGDYLFFLIDMFNPGMQELISSELYLFDESPANYPSLRTVICGKVEYEYNVRESGYPTFRITPIEITPQKTQNPPNAIKPK